MEKVENGNSKTQVTMKLIGMFLHTKSNNIFGTWGLFRSDSYIISIRFRRIQASANNPTVSFSLIISQQVNFTTPALYIWEMKAFSLAKMYESLSDTSKYNEYMRALEIIARINQVTNTICKYVERCTGVLNI